MEEVNDELKQELEELKKIDDVRPSSYTLGKIKKREAIAESKKEDAKNIIFESVEYYKQEYPNSTRNREWTQSKVSFKVNEIDDIDDYLDKRTEKELYELRDMVRYTQIETCRKIINRDRFDLVLTRIRKRIPGIKYVEKLEAIKEKEHKVLIEKRKCEELIQEERRKFEDKRLEVINKPIEIIDPESNEGLEPYRCSMCFPTVHSKGKIYYEHLQYKVD